MNIDNIDLFVFDFDGVLTNNLVYTNEQGDEYVACSRSDGLAFDVLRKLKKPTYILSTEKSLVVEARAKKLGVPVIQGVGNKAEVLKDLANQNNFNFNRIFYTGNDINDYHAMKLCCYTSCPADSHELIKGCSNFVLKSKGGQGVVREILEEVFQLDFIKLLY
jgi:YrbI family 3-deoxy-D-manno-octulosonate 8-phosphate phosphatase